MADDTDQERALVVLRPTGISFHGAGTEEARLMNNITNGTVEATPGILKQLEDLVTAGVAGARKVFGGVSISGSGPTIWEQRRQARKKGGSGQLPN